MKLSNHSWHVRLNDYVYGWGYSSGTTNLCPYFWGTVAAIFLSIPMWIGDKSRDFLSMGVRKYISRYGAPTLLTPIYLYLGIFQGAYGWLIALPIWFGALYIMYNAKDNGWSRPSWLKWFRGDAKPREERPRKQKVKKKHMTIEMFKAWKGNHCPIIEWE